MAKPHCACAPPAVKQPQTAMPDPVMDNERLIALVRARRPLWDVHNKQYHRRDIHQRMWREIGSLMDLPEAAVKRKWRSLRDQFQRELRNIQGKQLGPVVAESSQWAYFSLLLFLQHVGRKRSKGTEHLTPNDETTADYAVNSLNDDMDYAENSKHRIVNDESSTDTVHHPEVSIQGLDFSEINHSPYDESGDDQEVLADKKITKLTQIEMDSRLLQLEEEKINMIRTKIKFETNSDAQFLMSLIPYLEDIPKTRKLELFTDFMQIILNENKKYQKNFSENCHLNNTSVTEHQ